MTNILGVVVSTKEKSHLEPKIEFFFSIATQLVTTIIAVAT
jgi:hypothetical protein